MGLFLPPFPPLPFKFHLVLHLLLKREPICSLLLKKLPALSALRSLLYSVLPH